MIGGNSLEAKNSLQQADQFAWLTARMSDPQFHETMWIPTEVITPKSDGSIIEVTGNLALTLLFLERHWNPMSVFRM